ncbi:aldo/keto reductase [Arthrobacter sp. Soil763]|uniref:aldo/keto reductase n=1 Tax=Arthrobacter sp. Soil763 TaxID=1736402 RepID=UPI0006F3029A|nr:aldo/keto reductase [Arthrobacter sp. Soil763]KRE81777.1 aldo/keto reductase [Arthrobacter sp. Soil763]
MTELSLGRLGYGAAALGNLYSHLGDEAALRTLEAAWQGGVRYFDTAPHYGLGLSERRLGAFLRTRPREDYVISTKVGRMLEPNPGYRPGDRDTEGFDVPARSIRRWDFTERGIRQSLEDSLERLGIPSVDILFLHDPDAYDMDAALRHALPALERLKSEGLVRAIGVGSNSAGALDTLVERADLDLVMLAGRYTLLEQHAAAGLLPRCLERGVGVVAAGVFNSGILARPRVPATAHYNYLPAPPELLSRARQLAAVCEDFGVELPDAAIQFPLRHPAVRNVVIGARGARQIDANIAAMNRPLPPELWEKFEAEGLIAR